MFFMKMFTNLLRFVNRLLNLVQASLCRSLHFRIFDRMSCFNKSYNHTPYQNYRYFLYLYMIFGLY